MDVGRLPAVPTKSGMVHDYLREKILSGELTPGERLRMDALAKELGVSKIPIREAIQRLVSTGLVTQQTHVGPTVALVDAHELRGVYLTRLAVEPLAARLAAEVIDDEQLLALDQLQIEMRRALLAEDLPQLSVLNSAFHAQVAAASSFRVLADFVEFLLDRVRRFRVVAPKSETGWHQVISEHDAIVVALRARDPQQAEAAILKHVDSQSAEADYNASHV